MLRKLASIAFVLTLSMLSVPPLPARGELSAAENQARVAASSLNVRSGPGTTNPIVESLPRGTIIAVVDGRGDWTQIRLEDGRLGWVAARFLEAVSEIPQPAAVEPPSRSVGEPVFGGTDLLPEKKGGGSSIRGVLKWGSLLGAVAFGGLAVNERMKGDSSYDDYKSLIGESRPAAAETKYQETIGHDGNAQTYAIVGGSLLGLFLIQELFLGDGGGTADASLESRPIPALVCVPAGGGMRAGLRIRF